MRVLVTGADGFIGAHVVRALVVAGHDVLGTVFARVAREGELHVDLTDARAVDALPRPFDAVVHCAGLVEPRVPFAVMRAVNVGAARHLARWVRQHGISHLVHLSSVAVYGPFTVGDERREAMPRFGLGLGLPYMRTKAEAERVIESLGAPYTFLRPPVVLGPGDVISPAMRACLSGAGIPLVPSANPARRVSLASVEGVAEAVRRCLARRPECGPLQIADAELSFVELAAIYARKLGVPLEFRRCGWPEVLRRRHEPGLAWIVASTRFGQHYCTDRANAALGPLPEPDLECAISRAFSRLPWG